MQRGILGGTFDPPHLAHLIAAESAYRQYQLDVVSFVPAGAPWQKSARVVTPTAHRWEMTRRAVAGVDYFTADDREIRRDGWSYTVDTLREFAGDDLFLILGADAAAALGTWHEPAEVADRATLLVAPRPGTDRDEVDATGYRMRWIDMPTIPVSGTQIRARCAAGKSVRFMVREAVWRYITSEGLYEVPEEAGA